MEHVDTPLVAVVDDDESVRCALLRLLRMLGYGAEGFASAAEFLGALATLHPDCLIVDLKMPNMSGLELQQRLVALGDDLPVIVITAYDEPAMRERCLDAGIRHYLRKPIEIDGLLAAIEEVLLNRDRNSCSAI